MAELYYINTNKYSLKELNLSLLPEYRIEKINRLVNDKNKLTSACAGFLIKKYFGDSEIKLGEYGKPYADNGKKFSISHSGDYVIIAISDYEIGCDIELMRDLDYERLGKIVFHKNELKMLSEAEDKKNCFYKIWTAKEAFIKCLGEGFAFKTSSLDLSGFPKKLEYKNREFFFKDYMLGSYRIMLCGEENSFPDKISETKIEVR